MAAKNAPFIVTLAGINGKLGRCIVQHLLKKPNVHINGLTRDPNSAQEEIRNDARITLFANQTPTDDQSLRSAMRGSKIVICTYLGTAEFEETCQLALIRACMAEGVPRFMPSDFTIDYRKVGQAELPQKKPNRIVNAYLDSADVKTELKGVCVLIGAFMESLFSYGYFWFNPGPEGGIKYWGTADETWELISYDTTAQYVAELAVDESATGWFEFLGDRKTTKEIQRLLKDVYGDNIEIPMTRLGSFEELEENFQEGYARAPNDTGFDAWKRSSYIINLTSGKTYLKQPLDNQKYPNVQPEDLKAWLQKHQIDDLIKTAFF